MEFDLEQKGLGNLGSRRPPSNETGIPRDLGKAVFNRMEENRTIGRDSRS